MIPTVLSIGVVYLLAIGAGRLSAAVGVPRVTGYLIAGLIAGPAAGELLGLPALFAPEHLQSLAPLHDVVLGLIVFTIGGSFSRGNIRKIGPSLLRISAVEIGPPALPDPSGRGWVPPRLPMPVLPSGWPRLLRGIGPVRARPFKPSSWRRWSFSRWRALCLRVSRWSMDD